MRCRHLPLLLLSAYLYPINPATAGESLLELLSVLKDNGTISEAQYGKLADAVEEDLDARDEEQDAENQLQIDTKGGLEVSTYDGEFSFELGGRLMVDAAYYDESLNDLGSGTELRRARLDLEGILFGDWGYEFGIDFAGSDADIKDAYFSYLGFDPLSVQIGQFKEPFSLEELTSSRYISFMERALPNELAPGRHIGIGARRYWDSWTAAAGVFGEAFDDDADDEGDEGWALTGRLTYSPWHHDLGALHLGGALSRRWTSDEETAKFSTRPESHVTDVKYLNTGKIRGTETIDRYGLEAAWVSGPWSLQGEYLGARLGRESGLDDVSFQGWYLYGSWFLTGESRNYKFKKGAFGRVKPHASSGAWELVARYSRLDLDDGPVSGGVERNWTLGVNWYINRYVRLMANYTWVDNNSNADDDGDVLGNDDPSVFQTRIQADF